MDDFESTEHDPFDEISRLNTKAYKEGFSEGEISGKKTAFEQGFKIGQNASFSILSELGFYSGQCELYQIENKNELENISKLNSLKLAAQICQLIDSFDMANCHSDQFASNLSHLRDKYKQFCSITNSKNNFSKQSGAASGFKLNF